MRTKDYTSGVLTLLKKGVLVDDVLRGLHQVLTKNHHQSLYPRILSTLLAGIVRDTHKGETRITLARESDTEAHGEAIARTIRQLQAEEPFTYRVDPSVIGGYHIEAQGKSSDHTYKTQLQALYKSLTESL